MLKFDLAKYLQIYYKNQWLKVLLPKHQEKKLETLLSPKLEVNFLNNFFLGARKQIKKATPKAATPKATTPAPQDTAA